MNASGVRLGSELCQRILCPTAPSVPHLPEGSRYTLRLTSGVGLRLGCDRAKLLLTTELCHGLRYTCVGVQFVASHVGKVETSLHVQRDGQADYRPGIKASMSL